MVDMIVLSKIRLRVSATPMGLTPGFLFRAINLHAIRLSIGSGSTYSLQRHLETAAIASHRSLEW